MGRLCHTISYVAMLGNIRGSLLLRIFPATLGRPRKLKYVHVTISCLDGHPRNFIREKLQDDQTSKILYLENFPIYGST